MFDVFVDNSVCIMNQVNGGGYCV